MLSPASGCPIIIFKNKSHLNLKMIIKLSFGLY
jgi:hypothetical protein